jgi:hypothetical protein
MEVGDCDDGKIAVGKALVKIFGVPISFHRMIGEMKGGAFSGGKDGGREKNRPIGVSLSSRDDRQMI